MRPPSLAFTEINPALEGERVAEFLSNESWPFHYRARLTLAEARAISLGPPHQTRAFWIGEGNSRVGLVRALDLDDADEGSVLFDLRVAGACRGRGIGGAAIAWLVEFLFTAYPNLHRIQANTRIDNDAMRRALEANHFALEGRLRQTWRSHDGSVHDTALYGRLRGDAQGAAANQPNSMMQSVAELPFNRLVGIQVAPDTSKLLHLPAGDRLLNHLGTVHASALLSLAEASSGEFLLRHFGTVKGVIPVVRRIEAKFRRPANGAVASIASASPEALAQVDADLAGKGRALISIGVELHDESGSHALSATVEWFIQREAPKRPEA